MARPTRPVDGAIGDATSKRAVGKKTNGATNGSGSAAPQVDQGEVARRAYEIYQSRGEQHGAALEHWLEAERQLKPAPAESAAPPVENVASVPKVPKPRKVKKAPEPPEPSA